MAKYKFSKPWNFGSETITEVEVKENFTAGDIRKLKNSRSSGLQGDFELAVIMAGTNYTQTQADMIPAEDFDSLVDLCANFIPHGKSETES